MKELGVRLGGIALMSTQPADWELLAKCTHAYPQVHSLFGIHPWFAHHYSTDHQWLDDLRERLISTPNAGVGEIGLDRKWRPPDTGQVEYQDQIAVFIAQLHLAAELSLPVSIHCVHAQGDLYRILNTIAALPPVIYLHAFGGAKGTADQLIKSKKFGHKLYFGFASCINLRSPKTRDVIQVIPEDRLLLESDRGSAASPQKIQEALIQMLNIYSEIKAWNSLEQAAFITYQNAQRFYQCKPCSKY